MQRLQADDSAHVVEPEAFEAGESVRPKVSVAFALDCAHTLIVKVVLAYAVPGTATVTPDVPELVDGNVIEVALEVLPSGPVAAPAVTVGAVPVVDHPCDVEIWE